MGESIIVAIITGAISVIGVIIANSKTMAIVQNEIKHLQEEIAEMKADIKEHNSYGKKFLEMQGDIKVLENRTSVSEHRISDLERK